ncbi:MAG TPA: hypothetical protein VFX49_08780 [Chloroflexota bacterium]|nr:hypothetical protein [Chloroflexota bacterium]
MDRANFVAWVCIAVALPAVVLVWLAGAVGAPVAQGIALVAMATIGVATIGASPRAVTRRSPASTRRSRRGD